MRTGDGADDLEAIPPLDDGTPDATVHRRLSASRNRKRVLLGVCAVAIFAVGTTGGVALGRRGNQTRKSVQRSLTASGRALTTAAVQPQPSTTLARPGRDPLRTIFTQVASTGAAVTASAGLVSVADAQDCPVASTAPFGELPGCPSRYAEGVQFDFTAPGKPSYRLTVLTAHTDTSAMLQPVAGGPVTVISANGTTSIAENPQLLLAAFRVRSLVAVVHVTLSDGTPETLRPIDGWAAIVAARTGSQFPFRIDVEGLDARGRVVAKTRILRCC